MNHAARCSALSAVSTALCLAAAAAPAAVLDVTIGNGPDAVDGTYINAGSLANTMAFTSVSIQADNGVTVADPVDLSTSLFGPTWFDLFLQAPTVTIDGTVKMGAGSLWMNAATVNLNAEMQASDGSLLDASRLVNPFQATGPAVINVDGAGSVQQATTLGFGWSGPATINLLGGAHPLDSLSATGSVSAAISGGSIGGATLGGGGVIDWTGGQILEGVLNFSGTFNVHGAGFQVAPWGDCATTPEASWQAAPAQLLNQAQCVRGVFADGSTFRTAVNSIGTTNFIGVAVVPVPAAAWLLGSGLAALTSLRRLRQG